MARQEDPVRGFIINLTAFVIVFVAPVAAILIGFSAHSWGWFWTVLLGPVVVPLVLYFAFELCRPQNWASAQPTKAAPIGKAVLSDKDPQRSRDVLAEMNERRLREQRIDALARQYGLPNPTVDKYERQQAAAREKEQARLQHIADSMRSEPESS